MGQTKLGAASPAEYINLKPNPERTSSAVMIKAPSSDVFSASSAPPKKPGLEAAQRSAYIKELTNNKELANRVIHNIKEYWWTRMCQRANTQDFYGVLFEAYMFDDEGVLDIEHPAFRKIVQTLTIAYMHICNQFGEKTLPDWKVEWSLSKEHGPHMNITNHDIKQSFAMTQPKKGFLAHGHELAALRKMREAGQNISIPEDKKKFYGPGQGADDNVSNSKDSMEPLTNDHEECKLDEGHCDIIEEFEDDDDMFAEAREKVPYEGYVYKVEDCQKMNLKKKGWFW